jgi:hypothetical protein
MQQAMQGANQLGDYANQLMKDVRQRELDAKEEARYQTEQARLKVQDDRATTTWEQAQKERADLLAMKTAVGQGLLGVPEDALTMGQQPTIVQQTVSPQEVYMSQGRNIVVPGTSGRRVTTTAPGGYTNPNPEILFNRTKMVPGVTTPTPVGDKPFLETAYNKSAFTAPYRAVQGLVMGTGEALKKSWETANAPLKDRMNALKPNLQEFVNPTGSNKVLGMAGRESPQPKEQVQMVPKVVAAKTTLNDIDMVNLFNSKGKPVSAKDAGDGSKVYYRTKVEGALVNAMDVAKGAVTKENSYVQGKSEKTYIPGTTGYTKYVGGTTNKEFIGSNGTTVPVKTVVGSVQNAIGAYQDIVDRMGKGTTAEKITKISNDITKDVLKAHPELAHMAIDIQEMAKKGVGLKLPDGSLTKTEEMKLVAAGEDLKQLHSVQKEQRGYDQAWRLQGSSQDFQAGQHALNRAAARENALISAANKENSKTIPMFKKLATGETHRIDVPLANAKAYEGAGFTMGTVGGSKNRVPAAGTNGKSTVDLLTLGGGGTTSGIDLVTLASRMKAKYPKVTKSAIETEVANLSQGWFSDSVDLDKLEANLKGYGK